MIFVKNFIRILFSLKQKEVSFQLNLTPEIIQTYGKMMLKNFYCAGILD